MAIQRRVTTSGDITSAHEAQKLDAQASVGYCFCLGEIVLAFLSTFLLASLRGAVVSSTAASTGSRYAPALAADSTPAPGVGAEPHIRNTWAELLRILAATDSTPAPGVGAEPHIRNIRAELLRILAAAAYTPAARMSALQSAAEVAAADSK
jgi:hypothetical protein